MALELAWKPENFGPNAPHVVLKTVSGTMAGTYGVHVVTNSHGATRPVGSGRGASLEAATAAADRANRQMGCATDCG